MAVGATTPTMSTGVAAEDWTGSAWHRLSIGKPGGVSNVGLSAVSCPSATECVAVGWGFKGDNEVPVAETWTQPKRGATGGWKVSKPVAPGGNGLSALDAISCPSTSLCFAAGSADEFSPVVANQLPLAERWTPSGGWTRVKLPAPPRGSSDSVLYGISCKTSTQCAAVGTYIKGSTPYGLIAQLTKATWTVSTAPASANGILYGVSCPSAGLCVAVGAVSSATGGHNLAERWSGGRWTASAPAGAGSFSSLTSVSCASATHCVATGGTTSKAFIDTLDGTSWTRTAQTGSRGFTIGAAGDVSCFSTSTKTASCALLGATTPFAASGRPLSAFRTGSTWKVVFTV